jgi:hypothetical protein
VLVSGVTAGDTWDLRLRFVVPNRMPGPWAYVNNVSVLADVGAPAGLTGLTLSVISGFAYLRWDEPSEIDRLLDHGVEWRHSPQLIGATSPPTWQTSSPIGTSGSRANDRLVVLPLVSGTYLARVFSRRGAPSADVAMVDTSQISLFSYTIVASIDEAPDFGGLTDGFATDGSGVFAGTDTLRLIESTDSVLSPGTYYFEGFFDFATSINVRLITRISAISLGIFDTIDERTLPINSWQDFDGTNQAVGSCVVEVRYTPDNPIQTSAAWSAWERLDAGEFTARGFEFRAILSTTDPAFNVIVSELGVDAAQLT